MSKSISTLEIIPLLLILAALLSPFSVTLFRTLKNKIFILAICALNFFLACKNLYSSYSYDISSNSFQTSWPQNAFELSASFYWISFCTLLSLGGFLALLLVHKAIFHRASILFLLILSILQTLALSNNITMLFVLCLFSGLLICPTFCFTNQDEEHNYALTSLLVWHCISDILLLFSIASWHLKMPVLWTAYLFLIGLFIRSSYLISTISTNRILLFSTSIAHIFYFFANLLSSALLFIKTKSTIEIPFSLLVVFGTLYGISAVFAFLNFISQNHLKLKITALVYFLLSLLFVAIIVGNMVIILTLFAFACALIPFLFYQATQRKLPFIRDLSTAQINLIRRWRIDEFIEKIFLKTLWHASNFVREVISPAIFILWAQIPAALNGTLRLVLKLLNAGGSQKAIMVMFLGLIVFLLYYVEIWS